MWRIPKIGKRKGDTEGQGLVEMALITPILVFMLIGLFEVGYALWGYLTLVNVDREATRFAVRAGALDFDTVNASEVGYQNVVTHTLVSNAGQLNLEDYFFNNGPDEPIAGMIITHIVVDTREPCRPKKKSDPKCYELDPPVCDPDSAAFQADYEDYTGDDLVLYPDLFGYDYLRYTYPLTRTGVLTSRIDSAALAQELKKQNDKFNCELQAKSDGNAEWSDNSVVIVETFYEQPQLLGFPLFAWIGNPIPLYAQTTMRIESNAEGRCILFPIIAWEGTINSMKPVGSGKQGNLLAGPRPPGNSGWVAWNPNAATGSQSATYLEEEFQVPRLSMNDYVDPTDPTDDQLNRGDWVAGLTGVTNSSFIRDTIGRLSEIIIPVYDTTAGTGQSGRYHVIEFARVRIRSFNLPPGGNGGTIMATLVQYPVDEACPGNGF